MQPLRLVDLPLPTPTTRDEEPPPRWSWLGDPEMWTPCDGGEPGCTELVERRIGGICPTCEDRAKAVGAAAQRAARVAAFATANRVASLLRAGIPSALAEESFEEPAAWPRDRTAPEVDPATWNGKRPWCVLLYGPTGGGKTMLAVELAYRALKRGQVPAFVRAAHVPGLFYGKSSEEARERLFGAPFLIVDDLGSGHRGESWGALEELVAERYDGGRGTVFTSNMPLSMIARQDAQGVARIVDRMATGLALEVAAKRSRRGLRV